MMKALVRFSYAQHWLEVGERFNVNSKHHITMIEKQGLAVADPGMREPAPPHYVANELTAADPAPIVPPKRGRGRPKGTGGTYKRRDLVAE